MVEGKCLQMRETEKEVVKDVFFSSHSQKLKVVCFQISASNRMTDVVKDMALLLRVLEKWTERGKSEQRRFS